MSMDSILLKKCFDYGILNADEMQLQIKMHERKQYLEMHGHKIWQGKDGGWFTYIADESKPKGRRLIRKKNLFDLEQCVIEHIKEPESPLRLNNVFQEWVERKLSYREIKKQTYDRYLVDYERFLSQSPLNEIDFDQITEDMLEEFIRITIRDFDLTSKAYSNLRTLILGMFKYAKKRGYTTISISGFVGDLDIPRNAFRKRIFTARESVFTKDEKELIVNYINSRPPSIINLGILLCFETGLRIGEISALKNEDVDLRNKCLTLHRTEVRYKNEEGRTVFDIEDRTKGREGFRRIAITNKAAEIFMRIRRMNPFGEYMFMGDKSGKRINGTYFTVKLRNICKSLGIQPRSMHKIRKTYGTQLLNAHLNDDFIMNQMGHTDILTTRRHYCFDNYTDKERQEMLERAMGE